MGYKMFVRTLKMHLNVLFHKNGFKISFLVVFSYVIVTFLYYVYALHGYDVLDMYHPVVLSGITSDIKFAEYFTIFYPFLAVLPAGFAFMDDRETNIYSIIQSREGIKTYYISKMVAAFIVGLVVFTVPFFIGIIMNLIAFPSNASGLSLTNLSTYSSAYLEHCQCYFFVGLYHRNIFAYYFLSILLLGIFSGFASMFVASISTFKIKFKILLLLPLYALLQSTYYIGLFLPDVQTYYEFYIMAADIMDKNILVLMFLMIFMVVSSVLIINRRIKGDQLF